MAKKSKLSHSDTALDLARAFEEARAEYNDNPKSDSAERRMVEAGNAVGNYVASRDLGTKYYSSIPQDSRLAREFIRPAGENPNDILDFFKSYVGSPGMDRILGNQEKYWYERHPFRRYLVSPGTVGLRESLRKSAARPIKMYELNGKPYDGVYRDNHVFIYRPSFDNNDPVYYDKNSADPYLGTAAHEIGHHFNSDFEKMPRGQLDALDVNIGYDVNGHDELPQERMSDAWGMKYLLYKTGIYDSRGNEDVTPEQIGKLRDIYPNIRMFQQMPSNDDVAKMLNLVADNGSAGIGSDDILLKNYAASGGTIHIKPENRGKFTALKKRTGHSASWFKAHGTPAQKKMAVFALNAKKWKHGDGGIIERMTSVYGDDIASMRQAIQRAKLSK